MATASNHGFPGFQLHISSGLQVLQPVKDCAVLAPGRAGVAWDRLDLGDGLALHFEIDFRIAVSSWSDWHAPADD